jgi:hypothetical protein
MRRLILARAFSKNRERGFLETVMKVRFGAILTQNGGRVSRSGSSSGTAKDRVAENTRGVFTSHVRHGKTARHCRFGGLKQRIGWVFRTLDQFAQIQQTLPNLPGVVECREFGSRSVKSIRDSWNRVCPERGFRLVRQLGLNASAAKLRSHWRFARAGPSDSSLSIKNTVMRPKESAGVQHHYFEWYQTIHCYRFWWGGRRSGFSYVRAVKNVQQLLFGLHGCGEMHNVNAASSGKNAKAEKNQQWAI